MLYEVITPYSYWFKDGQHNPLTSTSKQDYIQLKQELSTCNNSALTETTLSKTILLSWGLKSPYVIHISNSFHEVGYLLIDIKDKELHPDEISLLNTVITLINNAFQNHRMQNKLDTQNNNQALLLEIYNQSSKTNDLNLKLANVLNEVFKHFGLSRLLLFENHTHQTFASCIYEIGDDLSTKVASKLQDICYQTQLEGWLEHLQSKELINSETSEFV